MERMESVCCGNIGTRNADKMSLSSLQSRWSKLLLFFLASIQGANLLGELVKNNGRLPGSHFTGKIENA